MGTTLVKARLYMSVYFFHIQLKSTVIEDIKGNGIERNWCGLGAERVLLWGRKFVNQEKSYQYLVYIHQNLQKSISFKEIV